LGADNVSNIDKQRVAAVRKLEELGYKFAGEWMHPANDASAAVLVPAVTDPMHAILVQRADMLEGCRKGSVEEAELEVIVDAIDAYEEKRWPLGKEPGGKG
jgi:hypothetical protein